MHSLSARLLVPSLMLTGISLSTVSSAMAQEYAASAFNSCPPQAHLTQGSKSRTYGIDLLTGDYKVLADSHHERGTKDVSSLNALGFNANDRFVYGWSYKLKQPVRVHKDWTIESLGDVNTTNKNFYVGDVSIPENRFYIYRPGSKYGLYYFELDPAHPEYQKMQRVVDGKTLNLKIADFAFHPSNGFAYAVDRTGHFHQIDVTAGTSKDLGYTGVTGTFGAAYFDPDGNLYIGRNNDGKIFRLSTNSGTSNAELFAAGPSSTFNDGFRCAIAPLNAQTVNSLDFGDAPDSYGTSLTSNGARHSVKTLINKNQLFNQSIRLGESVDGESDAYAFPAIVNAPGGGVLSVWIDVDRNGVFDANDQVVADKTLQVGENKVQFTLPGNLTEGDSWARFRVSSVSGLLAVGGAPDGEVEDYPVKLLADPVTVSTYPSKSGWSTVAFEDNWPFVGDYDMNDLVTQLRTQTFRNSQGTTKIAIQGRVAASGAAYKNGFAIRLPGVKRHEVDEAGIEFALSDRSVALSPLEAGRKEAILIITENVFDHVAAGPDCLYYRTEPGCGADMDFSFKLTVPFKQPLQAKLSGVFDPFLFATPGAFHGAHFVTPPGRSYEVHLKNQAPTEAFNTRLFAGVGQDKSAPNQGLYFLTATGMPWALEVGDDWLHPREKVEISKAYPGFSQFAVSNGAVNRDWYLKSNAVIELVFSE